MFLHDVNYEKFTSPTATPSPTPPRGRRTLRCHRLQPPHTIRWEGDPTPADQRPALRPRGVQAPRARPTWLHHAHPELVAVTDGGHRRVPRVLTVAGRGHDRRYTIDNNTWMRSSSFLRTCTSAPLATCVIVLKKSKGTTPPCSSTPARNACELATRTRLDPSTGRKSSRPTGRRDVPHFARLVDNGEIARNGYNIAVSSNVEQRYTREAVDIGTLTRRSPASCPSGNCGPRSPTCCGPEGEQA
jgi:type I restriction enzyme M protein